MRKVAIFGPPRSGTSWLSHIFNSHPAVALRFQPLFSYGHKGDLSSTSSHDEILRFFNAIFHTSDTYALMQTGEQKKYPVFHKAERLTHIVFKETRYINVAKALLENTEDVVVVGIIRDPLATLASWLGAPKEFLPGWDISTEWRRAPSKNQGRPEEFFGFEKWKEAALLFLKFEKRCPERFKLIQYNSLNSDPLSVTSEVFGFCGLSVGSQTRTFIEQSRSRHDTDPYSVYRNRASDFDWQEALPKVIAEAVYDELAGTPLEKFLTVR